MIAICLGLLFISVVSCSDVSPFRRKLQESLHTDHEKRMLSEIYDTYNSDYVDKFLSSRRRLERVIESMNFTSHHKAWMAVAEVDGLKNTEIISFVTSTVSHGESLLWER